MIKSNLIVRTTNRILVVFTFLICFAVTLFGKEEVHKKRELRGTWISTVMNIDWPSKAGLDSKIQKEELTKMLDKIKACNMNSVVLQIRPTADALYESALEPWSQWLSGTQGVAPISTDGEEKYDPLAFAIEECNKRGLAIHVWLNPYRVATNITNGINLAKSHIYYKHPEWFVQYGKALYFNPTLQESRDFVSAVVGDVVRKYDIDAIHFDDYFYPYKIKDEEFPDSLQWAIAPNGFTDKGDWRRDNVTKIIKQIQDTIKSIKPWVEFGISPFGVWRNKSKDPNGSDTKATTNYDDLYADILKWQKEKMIDYVAPQIYWAIGYKVADYEVLAKWWDKNTYGLPTYVGHGSYKIDKESKEKAWQSPNQIINQLKLNSTLPNIKGSLFFSSKSLCNNEYKLKELLLKGAYKYLSLPPENPNIVRITPSMPKNVSVEQTNESIILTWEQGENSKQFVLYRFLKDKSINLENPEAIIAVTGITTYTVSLKDWDKYRYILTSLSPSHTESDGVCFELK